MKERIEELKKNYKKAIENYEKICENCGKNNNNGISGYCPLRLWLML